jgi:CBS domain-containing protein
MESEPADAKSEFWIAIAGPVASVVIAACCLGAAWEFGWKPMSIPATPPLSVLVWLGYINLTLAAFNLIPGYPLDGGRVLRAVVWWISGNAARAMRVAALGGRIVALLFIAWGLLRFATGAPLPALRPPFLGWFLLDAANASYMHHRVTEVLRGVRAGDLMIRDCPTVDSWTNLETFIDSNALHSGRFCFIVTRNGEPVGLIGPREIHEIPRPQWPYRTLGDIMRPLEDAPVIGPEVSIADALEKMGRERVNQLPVAEGGHIQGILSRATILGFLEARAHLRI